MRRVYLAFAASAALLIAGAFVARSGVQATDEWPDQSPKVEKVKSEWPMCPPPKECRAQ